MHITFNQVARVLLMYTAMTQYNLINGMFQTVTSHYDTALDSGAISRWCRGTANVSPMIYDYYRLNGAAELLAQDIESEILSQMPDPWAAVGALQTILDQSNMSHNRKQELSAMLEGKDIASYIANIIYYTLADQRCRT